MSKKTATSRTAPTRNFRMPPLQSIIRTKWFKLSALWLLSFTVLESYFFSEIMGNHNYLELFPRELVFPTIMHAATAALITAAVGFLKRPRSFGPKLLMAFLLALLMINYDDRLMAVAGLVRALIPILPKPDSDIPLISALFLTLLFFGVRWIGLFTERLQSKYQQLETVNIVVALFLIVGVIGSSQASGMLRVLPDIATQSKITPAPLTKPTASPNDKPDIYYIVLDRYTNNEVLNTQLGFSNSDFTGFLRQNGFTVKENAYSNYPYTAMSVSSTLNASYTADIVKPFVDKKVQSHTLYHNLIYQASVIKALKDAGYEYINIGTWYGATNRAPLASKVYNWDQMLTVFGKNKRLHSLESQEFRASPYYRFTKVSNISWWPASSTEHDPVVDVREQLATLNTLSTESNSGGRFIFAHILTPHDPFYFNADGSLSQTPGVDNNGKNVRQKYLDQIQFINAEMQKIITNVQTQSAGKAIVLLNSDEGAYPQSLEVSFANPSAEGTGEGSVKDGDMSKWSDDWLKMKYGILQAVRIPNATPEALENLSSVNLFRIVLNSQLGYNLPYLPNCHFALTNGIISEYQYTDITGRFNNNDPECSASATDK